MIHQLAATGKTDRSEGTQALVLVPTRELCVQVSEVINALTKRTPWLICGSVMGGEKRKSEKARLRKGVSILVSTPGRLLDHLNNTRSFVLSGLRFIVFDEADRLLDMGFENDMLQIVDLIKHKKQVDNVSSIARCVLASATLSPRLRGLANALLRDAEFVSASQLQSISGKSKTKEQGDSQGDEVKEENSTLFSLPSGLKQGYLEVSYDLKIQSFVCFVTWKARQKPGELKVVMFVMSCAEAEFYAHLFDESDLLKDCGPIFKLHGKLSQTERTQTYLAFSTAKSGLLICTNVAARGLDLPRIDWIIQYSPPENIADYVHRVGRTARIGHSGKALMLLDPSELGLLQHLKDQGMSLTKLELSSLLNLFKGTESPLLKFYALVNQNESLHQQARDAFLSFTRGYTTFSKSLKQFFNIHNLHLGHVARSFALKETPRTIVSHETKGRDQKQARTLKSGTRKFGVFKQVSEFDSGM
jgi:ATP-dependent RNA helicase DDX31/DBP7